jgi:aspartate 1-decarboxylase
MLIEMLLSKIHRATVTETKLEYTGSITVDSSLVEAVNLRENQKVDVLNINNGERFSTYIINGKKDSGEICLNGACARKAQIGDKIIIVAYGMMTSEEADKHKPKVIMVDDSNKPTKLI